MPTARRRVIVNADDFGLHPALNAGIEQAHRAGLVTSASLLAAGPAVDDALRRGLPDLDLGLHFALTGVSGLPPTLSAFVAEWGKGHLPSSEIARLLRAQMNAARHLTLSHVDCHQHLHALPWVMRAVCALAREYDIPRVRLPLDGPPRARVGAGRRGQAAMLGIMARISRRILRRSGLQTTDYFDGMAVSGHLTAETLAAYLTHARPGTTEIVCHPGADNAALRQVFAWGYNWQGELTALCAPAPRAVVDSGAVTLVPWRAL